MKMDVEMKGGLAKCVYREERKMMSSYAHLDILSRVDLKGKLNFLNSNLCGHPLAIKMTSVTNF